MDREDIETVEQILSEHPLLYHSPQVSMRGGNNPHVECNFSVFPHAQDAVLLQYAQELCLEGSVQLANLIEEEDTTLSRTDQTFPIAVRAGKSAAPVPKQFALCQGGTQRTTVEGHER